MAFYVRIGRIPQNPNGMGARGWQVFRRNHTVWVRYGRVVVIGAGSSQVAWAGPHWPREVKRSFKSKADAIAFIESAKRDKNAHRDHRGGAYQRLPPGKRIHAWKSPES